MITMLNFGNEKKAGRLGNQLFQYASLYGIAKASGQELGLPEWKYEKYFNGTFPTKTIDYFRKDQLNYFYEQHFECHLDTILDNLADNKTMFPTSNVNFKGYFQSYKYWQHCEKEVRDTLAFKDDFKEKIRAGLPTNLFDKPTVAVCIRRGDYVGNPHYYQIPISYYTNALMSLGDLKNFNIVFFSDDINYCKRHFECIEGAYFSEGRTDIEDLCFMSMCSNHIIGNSTFHWWGAYLANHEEFAEEFVVYPSDYFDGDLAKRASTVDFWLEKYNWIERDVSMIYTPKIPFVTVYKKDSEDREQNFILCERFIEKDFYQRLSASITTNAFPVFHRTRNINDMVRKFNMCDIIISIDVDVIVPPMQIMMAVKMIENDEADIVYPYGGNFIKLNRASWYDKLAKSLDVGILPKFPDTRMSLGGCVVFNREKFIEAGMENENFISYGPEDKERFTRFIKLGLRVERIQGNLYHMNHHIGKDSSAANPHYQKNCDEYQKVKRMTPEELKEYIKTWSWMQST